MILYKKLYNAKSFQSKAALVVVTMAIVKTFNYVAGTKGDAKMFD